MIINNAMIIIKTKCIYSKYIFDVFSSRIAKNVKTMKLIFLFEVVGVTFTKKLQDVGIKLNLFFHYMFQPYQGHLQVK